MNKKVFNKLYPLIAAILLSVLLFVAPAQAERMHACFTPGEDCTGEIVAEIDKAQENVLVQAYGFTSPAITAALIGAMDRGVDVRVILDKSQRKQRCNCDGFSCVALLSLSGIPVLIDTIRGIAHNKVMIIDGDTVITGSFNFTKAAQTRNAENLIIIRDEQLAEDYAANWRRREARSEVYEVVGCKGR